MDLRLRPRHACRGETETPQCGAIHTVLQGQVPTTMGTHCTRWGLSPIQDPEFPEPMALINRGVGVGEGWLRQWAPSSAQLF